MRLGLLREPIVTRLDVDEFGFVVPRRVRGTAFRRKFVILVLGNKLPPEGVCRFGGSALLEKVTRAAGARCVAVFKGARQHVPRSRATRATEQRA